MQLKYLAERIKHLVNKQINCSPEDQEKVRFIRHELGCLFQDLEKVVARIEDEVENEEISLLTRQNQTITTNNLKLKALNQNQEKYIRELKQEIYSLQKVNRKIQELRSYENKKINSLYEFDLVKKENDLLRYQLKILRNASQRKAKNKNWTDAESFNQLL